MDADQLHELEVLEGILSDPSKEPIKLSYGLLKFITKKFSNEIGCGGFGTVYKGDLQNGKVAVKKIFNTHNFSDKLFMDEINNLKGANHKNIVRFLGYCADTQEEMMLFNGSYVMAGERNRLLCFEYVPNGNIRQYLQQVKPHGDDWPMRYQMIRGICRGLNYLHNKQITHLDLKPANVMLDAQMEAKITDFGLSRCLDQEQSNIITQNIFGTPRYIAPEMIDKREISLKSDIYSLGIIIIELLTGNNKIDLENWAESLDVDCPRARKCTEIARKCTKPDKYNRPTVSEIICALDKLESMIPQSSTNQVTVFPGIDLVDVYPLELRFPFVPNQEMHCHLSLTNKQKDSGVYCVIIPEVPNRYCGGFEGFLPPMCTAAITLSREAGEELPSGTDKLVLITGSDEDFLKQQLSLLPLDKDAFCEDTFMSAHELLGFQLHRVILTAVVVISEDDNLTLLADTTAQSDIAISISSMDVHPTEPWVLIDEYRQTVCIWNWQTKERIGELNKTARTGHHGIVLSEHLVAKFIAPKQWAVIGDFTGSIFVWTCPTMHHLVKEFRAHKTRVTSLAVHPTRPLLLSCGNPAFSLKLWDWDRDWSCIAAFDTTSSSPLRQVMFDPKHTSSFATLYKDGIVKMWRIRDRDPITTKEGLRHYIWDLQDKKHVHTLFITGTKEKIVSAVCHPTLPVLVTASGDGTIRMWDSTTYRLKKAYVNIPKKPLHIGFTGSRSLVIGHEEGITVVNIDV